MTHPFYFIGMFEKVCFSPNFRKNAQKYKKAPCLIEISYLVL